MFETTASPSASSGRVIWITGLSGAGKSTVSREVVRLLAETGCQAILLDGDEVRAAIEDDRVGHDRESRLTNARRICRLSGLLARQGFTVVTATMSLFREVHTWNRAHLPNYFEVYLEVSLEVLRQRDARGLYSRAENGTAQSVVGIHLPFDPPSRPDLVIKNEDPLCTPADLAARILEELPTTTVRA